ncbi:hypothetical protein [Nocardioides convexus]|uniref:hypothetical protein n=1 Tax=Nocardioides convexus TaxID=2712224 RepID=UPI0024188FC8|nr:hypothetical protein [Nocardioides convexus]
MDFATALEIGRTSTVFTTHTPVPAGIDRFPRELVEQHLGDQGATPGVPVDRVLALGAEDYDGGDPGVFNMAVMGFRLAQRANGVSQSARARQPRDVQRAVARLRRGRGPDHLDHQRRARPHLGRAGGAGAGRRAGRRPRGRRRRGLLGRLRQGPRTRRVGDEAGAARAAGRRRPPPAAQVVGEARCRTRRAWAGSTRPSTRTC